MARPMAKKTATGPKRSRKKSAAKKKADRILSEAQVRDLQGKIRLGVDQAMSTLARPELPMEDFPVRGEADKQPEKPIRTRNDRRDAFIYRHAMNTDLTWMGIKEKLKARKRWRDDPLALGTSDEGVRAAANRYAKRHGLPAVPLRHAGRRRPK
jgi:hypothetical protein